MGGGTILRCPRCKPIGIKVTLLDGRRLGFVPTAEYVGYLISNPRGTYKPPPINCPNCGSPLEVKA